jgi:hypothetical protein
MERMKGTFFVPGNVPCGRAFEVMSIRSKKESTMKKVFVFVLLCGLCFSAFAQTDKPETSQPVSPTLTAIRTANNLAKYGYANRSASALIGAAEILAKTPTQALEAGVEKDATVENAGTKTDRPEFSPANLLADAKKWAARDANLLAWAGQVEQVNVPSAKSRWLDVTAKAGGCG